MLRVRLLESVCHDAWQFFLVADSPLKLLLRAQRRARRVRKAKEVLSDAEFIDIEQGVEGADEVGRADDAAAKMEPAEKPDG